MQPIRRLLPLIATALACGSGGSPATMDAPLGLQLDRFTQTELHGTYNDGLVVVRFEATETGPDAGSLMAWIDEHEFELRVDVPRRELESDGHGAVLTAEQRDALAALYVDLLQEVPEHTTSVRLLAQAASYWSEAPDGYAHIGRSRLIEVGDRVAGRQDALGDGRIDCLDQQIGQVVRSQYTDRHGALHTEDVQVAGCWGHTPSGDYDCMGRCGGSCGSLISLSSAWTQDCMDHDLCSFRLRASGGGSDVNCGDEYYDAEDDYAFGVAHGCGTGSRNPLGCSSPADCEDGPFEPDFYARAYPDLYVAFGTDSDRLCDHWQQSGIHEARQPALTYDPQFYRRVNADLDAAFGAHWPSYWRHYQDHGEREGRIASRCHGLFFSAAWYADAYPSVRSVFGYDATQLCAHFMAHGIDAGHSASAHFQIGAYRHHNPDLSWLSNQDLVAHYAQHGRHEGRRATWW